MPSVAQIRQQILAQQIKDKPDWVWTTGEPLVDIIDAVASFHQRQEFIQSLTKNILNSPTAINTFSTMMNNLAFRQQMASIIGLSLTQRTITYAGVPADVSNDVDAFIWYYMDRFGERFGFRRNTGNGSSGRFGFKYANTITGSCRIVFRNGDKLYKASVRLNGNTDVGDPSKNYVTGIIYSMGYGQRYNVPANTLSIVSVSGDITSTAQLIGLIPEAQTGGNDYQSNESYLSELSTNIGVGTGSGVRRSVAEVISAIDTIDRYLIVGTRSGLRFKGSMDVYIKGSQTETWTNEMRVGADRRVLVPYQPCEIISVTLVVIGGPNIVLTPTTDYVVQNTTGDFLHSVRQQTYIYFPLNAGDVVTPVTDTVILELEVDSDCITANKAISDYYSANREFARDYLVSQAQAQNFTVDMQVKTKIAIDQTTLDSLVLANLQAFMADFTIEDGTDLAELQASDIINSLYQITYNGNKVIDSVERLVLTKVDSNGSEYAPTVQVIDLGSLYLTAGQYWVVFQSIVVNV